MPFRHIACCIIGTYITSTLYILYTMKKMPFSLLPHTIMNGIMSQLQSSICNIQYDDCATIGTSPLRGGLIYAISIFGKNGMVLGSVFRQKVHLLRTYRTIQYRQHGRSVYSLYIRSWRHIYLGASCLGKYVALGLIYRLQTSLP